jgi:ubiquinone biosynthesis protein
MAATLDAHELTRLRLRLEDEAADLARPRIWPDTLGALAGTAWRALTAVAPDAPVLLLAAAASATGAPIRPPAANAGAIARAQRLVRNGGPAYIKLGQFIASAEGLLPGAWVEAFAWCRDDAPRLPWETVASVLDAEIGEGALGWIDREPLAAGSIGQVHRATLPDGTDVVVKLRRPELRERLQADIGALALAVPVLERLHEDVAAANLGSFVELFAQLTLEELDFRLEALNIEQSAAAFAALGMDFVRVPQPVPGLVTERVLVMERLDGVSYDRAATVLDAGVDGERMLELAIGGVLATALRSGLVQPDGTFGLVDFGICGRLDVGQRASIASYLAAFAASDARGQIEALRDFGAIPPDADLGALADELGAELARLDQRADGAVTFERLGDTVGRQLRILTRNGFRMPKDLILFFKNLLYLSSFAAGIAPEADVLEVVERAFAQVGSGEPAPAAA